MVKYKVFNDDELKEALTNLEDWQIKSGELAATFKFDGFKQAIGFVVQVAILAEKMNHHPNFSVSYDTVSFSYCTHDAGNKITDIDIELAKAISRIASS